LVTTVLWCSKLQAQESPGQYADDSIITTKVKSVIVNDMSLKGFKIHVNTYHGIVKLRGFVDSADRAGQAVKLAHDVKGVTEVKNDLVVK
jgi:hyperosmotically inducible protein